MYQPHLGDPLEMLDTPSMIVDLTLMEANIASLMDHFRARHVNVRPHLKTVKSPELAHILLAAGAVGGCVAKVSEADQGAFIKDILLKWQEMPYTGPLLIYTTRDRATGSTCFKFTMVTRDHGLTHKGTFQTVGGTGKAARITAKGSATNLPAGTHTLTAGDGTTKGSATYGTLRRAQGRSAACKALRRL